MNSFETYLQETGEIGIVDKVTTSVVYVTGLPKARPMEIVMLESGELGTVLSLDSEFVEVLLFSRSRLRPGMKAARTGSLLYLGVGSGLMGKVIDPLGRILSGKDLAYHAEENRLIDIYPPGIMARKGVDESFETGVALVDLAVPLGKGQRELVIGDRKIGKTTFLMQSMISHISTGGLCIYTSIAKRASDLSSLIDFADRHSLWENLLVVSSNSSDAPGLVYLTPYAAMTVAEYFRDQGKDVLVILDDLTKHAKYYRELTLLADRFPGRSAYPGDVFYIHSRLLERAGNFTKGSITCLPVAETVMGDISGYIQTNLMSMTDGHIYFDQEIYNLGRRPAVDPFLSVTRVGRQTQTNLLKSLSSDLSGFMVSHRKLQELLHFGGELSQKVRDRLAMGERINKLFLQMPEEIIPKNAAVIFLASIFSGMWNGINPDEMRKIMRLFSKKYIEDEACKNRVDGLIGSLEIFSELVIQVEQHGDLFGEREGVQAEQEVEGVGKVEEVEKGVEQVEQVGQDQVEQVERAGEVGGSSDVPVEEVVVSDKEAA